jgi:hypothetical protein
MIECFNNPFLLDFVSVCCRMPDDERAQLTALTGQEFDIDGAAIGNFTVAGPKWVIKADGTPLVVGGFALERPGVWRDFMLTTPEAWSKHWFPVTRICRRIMDQMFLGKHAHRIECIVPAARVRPDLERWYSVLGYNKEALLHGYCANGADAVLYARVQH